MVLKFALILLSRFKVLVKQFLEIWKVRVLVSSNAVFFHVNLLVYITITTETLNMPIHVKVFAGQAYTHRGDHTILHHFRIFLEVK
jgi:hypothetical protein